MFFTSLANDKAASRRIPPREVITRDCEVVGRFRKRWDQPERASYFCVATLKPGRMRRAKENVFELVCLHADLDFKNIDATRAEIENAIKRLPLRPQLVVFSGHGLHLYWLLDKVLPATAENIARIERLLKQLADVVAGDPAVCEVSRLMRLPGSHNTKYGQWLDVVVIEQRKGRYSLARLEQWLSTAAPLLRRKSRTGTAAANFWQQFGQQHIVKAPIDVEGRLAEMQYHGPGDSAIHLTQLSVTAALLRRGWCVEDVVLRVLEATMDAAGGAGRHWDWREEERALHGCARRG